jgi:hypothetical protein
VPIKVVFVSLTANPQLDPINIILVTLADCFGEKAAQVTHYEKFLQEFSCSSWAQKNRLRHVTSQLTK